MTITGVHIEAEVPAMLGVTTANDGAATLMSKNLKPDRWIWSWETILAQGNLWEFTFLFIKMVATFISCSFLAILNISAVISVSPPELFQTGYCALDVSPVWRKSSSGDTPYASLPPTAFWNAGNWLWILFSWLWLWILFSCACCCCAVVVGGWSEEAGVSDTRLGPGSQWILPVSSVNSPSP